MKPCLCENVFSSMHTMWCTMSSQGCTAHHYGTCILIANENYWLCALALYTHMHSILTSASVRTHTHTHTHTFCMVSRKLFKIVVCKSNAGHVKFFSITVLQANIKVRLSLCIWCVWSRKSRRVQWWWWQWSRNSGHCNHVLVSIFTAHI